MNRDHSNYSIIKICQNTEKSPGDRRSFDVTQTPVKDHQLTLICSSNEPHTEVNQFADLSSNKDTAKVQILEQNS